MSFQAYRDWRRGVAQAVRPPRLPLRHEWLGGRTLRDRFLLVTTEMVHLAAAAFEDDAHGFVPEGPESVM
jgi:hypothetical protein